MKKLDIELAVSKINYVIKTDRLRALIMTEPPHFFSTVGFLEKYRNALEIPLCLKHCYFLTHKTYPIPLSVKARVVRYAHERLSSGGFTDLQIAKIFGITTISLKNTLSGRIADTAIALEEYFVLNTINLNELRDRLSILNCGVSFNRTALLTLGGVETKRLVYSLVNRIKLSRSQLRKLFGLKIVDNYLLDTFYL